MITHRLEWSFTELVSTLFLFLLVLLNLFWVLWYDLVKNQVVITQLLHWIVIVSL